MSYYSKYRWCAVPDCKNTTVKTPNKLWIQVPTNLDVRKTWFKVAKRDPELLCKKTRLYFCEDHFDLEHDMENYMQYKIMGSVKSVRLKPHCIPSKFNRDRKQRSTSNESHHNEAKRRRISESTDSAQDYTEEDKDDPLTLTDNVKASSSCNEAAKRRRISESTDSAQDYTEEGKDDPLTDNVKASSSCIEDMAGRNTAGDDPPNFSAILRGEDSDREEEESDREEEDSDGEEDISDYVVDYLKLEYHEEEDDDDETKPFQVENLGVAPNPTPSLPRPLPIPSKSRSPPSPRASSSRSSTDVPSRDRSRSPLPWAPDAAVAPGSPPDIKPFEVVVIVASIDNDEFMEEEHVFHLADEHQRFQQVDDVAAEEPQQQRRPRRGGSARRGGAAVRGRGRGRGARGQVQVGDPECVSGGRLVKVYVDDDDVPEDLKVAIMRVVNARETERVRLVKRERRGREQNEEEFVDADDGEVESFFAAEGTSNQFEWSANMADFRGEREEFLPQQTGAVVASGNAYEAFRQFWQEDMLMHIVTQTNRHAAELVGSSAAFARDWYDTNVHEILILFSFWMMLGIIRMPSIASCFTSNPLLQTNVFRKMFTKNRYTALCRAFHLNDNSSRRIDSTDDLYALGPIVDRLNALFQKAYIPSQNICIDESLTMWKGGNLPFRQYIKTKAARCGVKTFELCESHTGYLWSFFIDRGAGTSYESNLPPTSLKSTSTVLQLIKPLLNKGYTLFMDNWFNSPLLARFLKARKTDCVGTLRANCTDVPPLMSLCKLKDGQFVVRHSGDVVVLTFQDKKSKIATISTYHGDSQGQVVAKPHRPPKYKPQVVLDYKKGMGGVDRKDLMLEPYLLERKRCKKWNVKFFKHLLNCSIFNARILLQSSTATSKEQIVFRLELVDKILKLHLPHVPPRIHRKRPVSSSLSHQPQVQHFPRQTDQLEPNGRRKRWRCTLCKRRTTFSCSVCEVYLCTDPCFELYHKR